MPPGVGMAAQYQKFGVVEGYCEVTKPDRRPGSMDVTKDPP